STVSSCAFGRGGLERCVFSGEVRRSSRKGDPLRSGGLQDGSPEGFDLGAAGKAHGTPVSVYARERPEGEGDAARKTRFPEQALVPEPRDERGRVRKVTALPMAQSGLFERVAHDDDVVNAGLEDRDLEYALKQRRRIERAPAEVRLGFLEERRPHLLELRFAE